MNKIEIPSELSERSKMGINEAKSETNNKRTKYFFILPTLAAVLVIGFVAPHFFTDTQEENPIITTIENSQAFDVSDTPTLVGWADNVFIGKVNKQNGEKSLDGIPETQFEVEVLNNIKGELNGVIKVNQQGGYKGDELILIEGDQILQEGKEYLFVTKFLEIENWYTLVPVYGDILISSDAEKDRLIKKFTNAYKAETPPQLK